VRRGVRKKQNVAQAKTASRDLFPSCRRGICPVKGMGERGVTSAKGKTRIQGSVPGRTEQGR
jgi:hypothetical protein